MINFIGLIGNKFNNAIKDIIHIILLIALFIKFLPKSFSKKNQTRYIFFKSFLDSIYQTGIRTLYVTSVLSILFGTFISLQIIKYFSINENNISIFADFLIIFIIREIAPLISGLILILRAGSFITIKLSLMEVRKEYEILKTFGIDPIIYILTPTLLSFPLALLAIIVYFDFVSISISYFVLYMNISNIEFKVFWDTLLIKIENSEIYITLLKAIIGGLLIGAINIYFSQKVMTKLSKVPNVTSTAITSSTIIFIVINFIISLIGY